MTAALVRSATGSSAGTSSTVAATLAGGAITAGNTLLAVCTIRGGDVVTPSGWTRRGSASSGGASTSVLFEKVAVGGESLTLTVSKTGSNGAYLVFMEYSGAGAFLSFTGASNQWNGYGILTWTSPSAASTDSASLAVVGLAHDHFYHYPGHGTAITYTSTNSYTIVAQASYVNGTFQPAHATLYKAVGAGTQVATGTIASDVAAQYGTWVAIYGTGGIAEPTPDPTPGEVLPFPPQAPLLEIKVAGPGTARWGIALWGVNDWSSAAWTDVTPEGVRIRASWGADRAEDGILARVRADTWDVDYYDPDRLLDPGNPDATWAGNLISGLPIRFSHRGRIIRYGHVESIGHDYAHETGYMRVTNGISYMANATVPTATSLPNTLRARARTAIAAAGLSITVEPDPEAGDPAVAAQIADESNVWKHITDAALQVLHIPYFDHADVLRFRAYAEPLDRARELAAPELVNLLSIRDGNGLYSTVRAFDGAVIQSRSATPTPAYGAKTFSERDTLTTIDAATWCATVLEDRVSDGLRWVPGVVRPLTADSVERFGSIEQGELVALTDAFETPGVSVAAIVLGMEVVITPKVDDQAVWSFTYATAQTGVTVLVEDVDGVTFLASDQDTTQFLLIG